VFAVVTRFTASADAVAAVMDEHVAFLEALCREGRVLLAGPDPRGGGGVILASGDDLEEVRRLFAADPFLRDAVAEYLYAGFEPKLAGPALTELLA
jgi:uncharacterized protein YciI